MQHKQRTTRAQWTSGYNVLLWIQCCANSTDLDDGIDARRLEHFLLEFIMHSVPRTDVSGVEEILISPVRSTATRL
jgi:hypothetical protein